MLLKSTIEAVVSNLRLGKYPNEQAISFQVVLPILGDLEWNILNPDCVWPEYSLKSGRVDYALCYPAQHPKVFVEVKQPGKGEGGDEQLFEYAVRQGVRMALLTDGRTWSFYLPGEEGSYEERRVYRLDLFERTADAAAEILTKYLAFPRIANATAIEDAVKELRDRSRRGLAKKTIPKAWHDIVEAEDTVIAERLSTEVEAKCGIKPELDDLVSFFKTLGRQHPTQEAVREVEQQTEQRAGGYYYIFEGQTYSYRNAIEVMIGILQDFARRDPAFAEKCYRHQENQGRVRTYIGRSPQELYPRTPHLEKESVEFTDGWFVVTNISNNLKEKIIKMACRVAGFDFGTQLKISL